MSTKMGFDRLMNTFWYRKLGCANAAQRPLVQSPLHSDLPLMFSCRLDLGLMILWL